MWAEMNKIEVHDTCRRVLYGVWDEGHCFTEKLTEVIDTLGTQRGITLIE